MATKYLRIYEENEETPSFTYDQLVQESFFEDLSPRENNIFRDKIEYAKVLAKKFEQKVDDIILFIKPESATLGVMFQIHD